LAQAPVVTPPSAPVVPSDWQEFLQSVDAAISAGRWSEVRLQLRNARLARPSPEWLAGHQAELAWRDMRTAQAVGDRAGLQMAARSYLTSETARSFEADNLAREWYAAGGRNDAVLLLGIVLERSPGHGIARAQLEEWQAAEKMAKAGDAAEAK
jgi:hypothetical protein